MPTPQESYMIVGFTIRGHGSEVVYNRLGFGEHEGRVRVEHLSCGGGSRGRSWYLDGELLADANALLARIMADVKPHTFRAPLSQP